MGRVQTPTLAMLAKVEELTEQNYNMIDNVLNNGAEKKGTGADQRQNFHKREAGREEGSHRAEGQGGTYFTGKGN